MIIHFSLGLKSNIPQKWTHHSIPYHNVPHTYNIYKHTFQDYFRLLDCIDFVSIWRLNIMFSHIYEQLRALHFQFRLLALSLSCSSYNLCTPFNRTVLLIPCLGALFTLLYYISYTHTQIMEFIFRTNNIVLYIFLRCIFLGFWIRNVMLAIACVFLYQIL